MCTLNRLEHLHRDVLFAKVVKYLFGRRIWVDTDDDLALEACCAERAHEDLVFRKSVPLPKGKGKDRSGAAVVYQKRIFLLLRGLRLVVLVVARRNFIRARHCCVSYSGERKQEHQRPDRRRHH